MKKDKIFIILIIISFFYMVFATYNTVYAGTISDWWKKATEWKNGGSTNIELATNVIDGLSDMVEIIGTAIIAIATVVVGIKYIFGTVEGKVQAKESLMNLLVACLFFFGWSSIRGILITGSATAKGGFNLIIFDGDLTRTFARIFTFFVFAGKIIAVLAIVYMGVKYIFAGADAKAQLKQKSPAMIIGIILIFCTTTVLGMIANVISDIL